MSTFLSSQRKIKVEPKWIYRRRKESSRETGRASFKARVPEGAQAHTHTIKALGGEDHRNAVGDRSHQHWPRALCFLFALGCILALQGGFNHQLLLNTSTTCPAFISLHSRRKTPSQKVCNSDSCESLTVQGTSMPLARARRGSRLPEHKWSARRLGLRSRRGGRACRPGPAPRGVTTAPRMGGSHTPAKGKQTRTVQYTVCCLSDRDRPHCVCSTRRGPNGAESKQCSV